MTLYVTITVKVKKQTSANRISLFCITGIIPLRLATFLNYISTPVPMPVTAPMNR